MADIETRFTHAGDDVGGAGPRQDASDGRYKPRCAERERLNIDIQQVLDAQTDAWGIKVSNVEIKRVDLDESMVRAIARQAEAERERRAKVIHAEGELQASEKLAQAAFVLAQQPGAMQLRYMQTLGSIAGDKSSTIVFPLPMELLAGVRDAASHSGSKA